MEAELLQQTIFDRQTNQQKSFDETNVLFDVTAYSAHQPKRPVGQQ